MHPGVLSPAEDVVLGMGRVYPVKMLFWGWGGCNQGLCPVLYRCSRHPFQSFSLERVSTRVVVVVVVVVAQPDCLPTLVRKAQA